MRLPKSCLGVFTEAENIGALFRDTTNITSRLCALSAMSRLVFSTKNYILFEITKLSLIG